MALAAPPSGGARTHAGRIGVRAHLPAGARKRELENARAALALKASHDALTGLLNRSGILEAMAAELQGCAHGEHPLAVVLIDLDHFKQVNDDHGHLVGDAVLATVGARLTACLRDSDKVGRYGGEELLLLLPGVIQQSQRRLRAIHEALSLAPTKWVPHARCR
ncbi:GGDEF domain-containing protein [Xanthomonas oryzae pv. oryzae]|nr:GGDEF domain-containing protein [Xanthomonas oryzae pv. oryzae]